MGMSDKYILVNRKVVPVTFDEWLVWVENTDRDWRRVALHEYNGVRVSTVFLALDHNWGDVGPPIVFETTVVIDEPDYQGQDFEMNRYATWDEAILGHLEICNKVFKSEWKERILAGDDELSDEDDGDRSA